MSDLISFRVRVTRPHSHLVDLEMTVPEVDDDELVLRMPVWTPGSYKVREYAKHLQDLEVRGADGLLEAEKIDKSSWRVDTTGCDRVTVTYRVYGFEVSPRFNHIDGSHAFFNPIASCLYPEGRLGERVEMVIEPPEEDWEVFCGLQRQSDEPVQFVADDYDELYDSPVEMGPHQWFDFEVRGVPHRFVLWSDEEIDLAALKRDLPDIVEQNASMFGEIPYDRYVFINHAVPNNWGGLEHRHSSVNIFGPDNFTDTDRDDSGDYNEDYANVLRLLSHEHFHAYHVKRLRPEELGPFDYQRENYSRALWAIEGVTSYFDTYQLRQADLLGASRYVELLEKRIHRLQQVPGRLVQSLEESSFDAWIKLYQRDENTPNTSVSYYLKGELAVWLMDLWIRDQSDGQRTMADAIRQLWKEYYLEQGRGFPRGAVEQAVSDQADADAGEVFDVLVRGAEPMPWEQFLEPVGLQLCPEANDEKGWLGIKIRKRSGGRRQIKFVARHSPADEHGLYVGDELIAIDKRSVRGEEIDELVADYSPGRQVTVDLIRRDRLQTRQVTVGEAPPEGVELKPVEKLTDRQARLLEAWMGTTQWDDE